MAEHHVHVYSIYQMVHLDVEAPTAAEAQAKALEMVDDKARSDIKWDQPDAKHIAVVFQPFDVQVEGQKGEGSVQ